MQENTTISDIGVNPQYKWLYIIECIVLFVIFPLLYVLDLIPIHKVIPLVALFAYCIIILIVHKETFKERLRADVNWRNIALRFTAIAILVIVLLKFFSSLPLFADLSANRKLLMMVILYPFLSAFPQELIFREFFFYRYRGIFRNQTVLLVVNILLFSFAHVYFSSWIVIIFTLVGGAIFAMTYLKTKSLLAVTVEHTLYGLLMLTSGLADYFYRAF